MANIADLIANRNQELEDFKQKKQEERTEAYERRDAAVMEVTSDPEKYRAFLDLHAQTMYNAANTATVWKQRPGATQLLPRKKWAELGRKIREDETPVQVFMRDTRSGYIKATIDTITRGETKGRGGSSSRNFQNTGRELVTPEELRMVDRDALLLIRGECPVLDRKYDLNRHPNIRYTEMGGAPPYTVPEDYCVLSAGISAEDVQEEWKKGTPLAPELLSAFEVLHSKEELEEKKIERKKEQA